MKRYTKPFAVVTGASSGIGLELARCCAEHGFDLLIAADEEAIETVAWELGSRGAHVRYLCADLSTTGGVEQLYVSIDGRSVDALFANAGHGLGGGFLDQDFQEVRHVINTNVTGTLYLLHKVARDMRARGCGRILVTGSATDFLPGTFQAVYSSTKAFMDVFSIALRKELEGTGVTVTRLMADATDTGFFERARLMGTKMAHSEKDDPSDVARIGFEAMMRGDADVSSGFKSQREEAIEQRAPMQGEVDLHREERETVSALG